MKQGLPFLLLGLLAARGLAADAGPDAVALPAPIDNAAINTPLVVAQIKAGQLTPEQAWQQGALKKEDLLFLLGQEGGDRGSLNLVDSSELGPALIELLVEHYPALVVRPDKLSVGVRLRLADYYFKQHNPRAALWLEGLLSEARATSPAKGRTISSWYYPIAATLLGEYYQKAGDYNKAIKVFMTATQESGHLGYMADWVAQIARTYKMMGDTEKANTYYAQVPQYGSGWFTGLVRYDQAGELMRSGQHEAARQLLQQPLTGSGAKEAQVVLLTALGYSYYLTGDFDESRQSNQEAIAQYKLLGNPPNLRVRFDTAQDILHQIDKWTKFPLVCTPREFTIAVKPDQKPTKRIIQRFYVESFQALPVTVVSNDRRIRSFVMESGWPEPEENHKEVQIEIAPDALESSFDSTITVQSPKLPDFKTSVVVHVTNKTP